MNNIVFNAIFGGLLGGAMTLFGYNRAVARMTRENYILPKTHTLYRHMLGQHFKGRTAQERVFVYCPVGKIASWNVGDYEHDWCHFCKKYFGDIKDANK